MHPDCCVLSNRSGGSREVITGKPGLAMSCHVHQLALLSALGFCMIPLYLVAGWSVDCSTHPCIALHKFEKKAVHRSLMQCCLD